MPAVAGLAAFMLATLLPLPEASAVNSYTDTACEGQDYRKPAGSLAFTVSGTQYIKVQTFEDHSLPVAV